MGRRSDFPRIPKDAYVTPAKAVQPLLPFLASNTRFIEPAAGDASLIGHLEGVWSHLRRRVRHSAEKSLNCSP